MSLGGALNIGRTGLLANRAAIETVGHNLANVSTPGYHRRTVSLVPVQGGEISQGVFLGRGVQIENIVRNVSEALETRLRSSISDSSASQVKHELLAQIEAVQNEFTDVDLSSNLSQFFDAWSELANTPDDFSKRTLVIEQGNRLASFMAQNPQVTPVTVDAIADGYLRKIRVLSPDARRLTDKMPSNFLHLGLIATMFPKARIVHCRRDPMDTCLSCYFQNFGRFHGVVLNAFKDVM